MNPSPSPPPSDDSEAFGGPGGSAVFNGAHYQTEVATYIAAVGLAEQPQQLGDAFPALAPTRIGLEQHWPIDDIAVWFGDTIAWIQAKRDLELGDLRDAFKQFVAQRRHGRGRTDTFEPIGEADRFVLAFGRAPTWAREADDVLKRIREGARLEDDITQGSGPAKDAFDKLVNATRLADPALDAAAVLDLLRHVWLFEMNTSALGAATRSALHWVVDNDGIIGAESVLFHDLHRAAAQRSSRDISALRIVLAEAKCRLLAPPSVREDVATLLNETERSLKATEDAGFIKAGDTSVHLDRAAVTAVVGALAVGNVIVTGPAGEGKSVVLRDAAKRLRSEGALVVFLEADGEQLKLDHTLSQIFEQWTEPGRLFIDGFDSVRLGSDANVLRRLIERLRGSAWHVAIAGRDYDIERDAALRKAFPAGPPIPNEFRDDRFGNRTAVIRIGPLSNPEIDDLRAKSTALDQLFASAPRDLANLLTNPFNLSIAAELSDVDLRDVRDRSTLLETWWGHRVAIGASEAEPALRALLREMISRRSLFLADDVLDQFGDARHNLLSNGVLVHRGSGHSQTGFRHAAIFEYAVERLLLTGKSAVETLLNDDPDAFVFILPSLRTYFGALFQRSPAAFIAELADLFIDGKGRATLLSILAHIPSQHLRDANDLVTLFDGSPTNRELLRHIISAARYQAKRGEHLVGEGARPFAELTLLAAEHIAEYPQDAPWLLEEVTKGVPTPEQGRLLARAARLAVIAHLQRGIDAPNLAWFALIVIPAFIRTIDFDPQPAHLLLQRLVAPDRLASLGQHEVHPLTQDLDRLTDTRSLEILYLGLFADVTLPAGSTGPARPNVALNLSMDNKQILGSARDALARRLSGFFQTAPREATHALCAMIRSHRKTRLHHGSVDVTIDDETRKLITDGSNLWENGHYSEYEDWKVALKAFEMRLSAAVEGSDAAFFPIALDEIGKHGMDMLLWRVLIRHAGKATASAQSILPLLLQPIVFRQAELEGPIKDFLRTGYARLTPAERAGLDEALVSIERDAPDDVRPYRRKIIEMFVRSVPVGFSTTLDRYRTESAEDDDSHDEYEAAFVDEDEFDDPALLEVTETPPSASASAGAEPQPAGLASSIRALYETIGDPALGSPSQLTQLLKLVRRGLVDKVLSTDDLREVTPALLAAAAFDPLLAVSDDGVVRDYEVGELARHAASTLPWVYQQYPESRLADAIVKLATHPDTYVRAAIVQHVMLLGSVHAEARWKIVEDAINDPNAQVASMAGDVLFHHLATIDEARAKQGWFVVYDRFAANVLHDLTIKVSRDLITLAIAGDPKAAERLDQTLTDPWQNPELTKLVVFALVTGIAPRSATPAALALQPRVLGFITRLRNQLDHAFAAYGYNYATYPKDEVDRTTLSVELLIELAHRLQAHMDIASPSGDIEGVDEARAHYAALLPLFEALAPIPIPHVGYYLVQALATVIDLDPRGALLLATQAVLTAAKAGLASDHFGQEKAREFLLRYVDDYRELLVTDREAFAAVMDVVDAFADVGWQEWIDIAIALEALYREQ